MRVQLPGTQGASHDDGGAQSPRGRRQVGWGVGRVQGKRGRMDPEENLICVPGSLPLATTRSHHTPTRTAKPQAQTAPSVAGDAGRRGLPFFAGGYTEHDRGVVSYGLKTLVTWSRNHAPHGILHPAPAATPPYCWGARRLSRCPGEMGPLWWPGSQESPALQK